MLVSGLGSGFCRALGSRLGWRLGPSSPRSPPCVLAPPPLGGGGWKRQTPDHIYIYMYMPRLLLQVPCGGLEDREAPEERKLLGAERKDSAIWAGAEEGGGGLYISEGSCFSFKGAYRAW